MGGELPKQFIELGGKSILRLTMEKFVEAVPGIRVVTVLPAGHIPYWREYCVKHNFNIPQTLVEGGFTRFHSVKNALEKVPRGAVVAIHDGVRPLISKDLIARMFRRMETCHGLIPVLPVTDTLKSLDTVTGPDGRTVTITSDRPDPDRGAVYAAQTPQIFLSDDIKDAYGHLAYDTAFTDDASVARRFGIGLSYETGEKYNIKITTPEDLGVVSAILGLKA